MNSLFLLSLNLILLALNLPAAASEADAELVCDEPGKTHLCVLARSIESAVEQTETLPFHGEGAPQASAAALVAVAWHESGFHLGYMDCSACPLVKDGKCDGGQSVSPFQLHSGVSWLGHKRSEICEDTSLAATLALHWLSHHGRRTKSISGMVMGYASGDPGVKSDAGHRIARLVRLNMARAGVATVKGRGMLVVR